MRGKGMTREEIIQGLQFTIDMFLLNPITGEIRAEHTLNDMDKTTVDACREAIKALEQEPKRGKWLAIRTKDGTHEITCSCCRYVRSELLNHHISEESLRSYLKDITAEYKYCYNCGAQMEGEVRE
jgi:hypothetical protein